MFLLIAIILQMLYFHDNVLQITIFLLLILLNNVLTSHNIDHYLFI